MRIKHDWVCSFEFYFSTRNGCNHSLMGSCSLPHIDSLQSVCFYFLFTLLSLFVIYFADSKKRSCVSFTNVHAVWSIKDKSWWHQAPGKLLVQEEISWSGTKGPAGLRMQQIWRYTKCYTLLRWVFFCCTNKNHSSTIFLLNSESGRGVLLIPYYLGLTGRCPKNTIGYRSCSLYVNM